MAKQKKAKDKSTEEKIKDAARKLFTRKGYAAVKTRDIAKEAGINVALLNYYFRSKEKLFEMVMLENIMQFMKSASGIFSNQQTTMHDKMQAFVSGYVDMLLEFPDLPLFVLNELRSGKSKHIDQFGKTVSVSSSQFIKQLEEEMKKGNMEPIHLFHLMANFIGLTVFPFIAAPILKQITGISDKQFKELVLQRKELIPLWMNAILNSKQRK